jgi:hypothetical protein
MSYLHYLCLLGYSGVFLCFVCLLPVSCVAGFSGLSIFRLPLRCSLTFD